MAAVPGKLAEHRQDLIRLLSFVHDPRALADSENLTRDEKKWLTAVEKNLSFDDPALMEQLSATEVRRARQAFTLLAD